MSGTAVISACGTYRYRLERQIGGDGKTVAVLMVNPSTADADINDPSITKLIGFSTRFGFSKLVVGNKFAYRATEVRDLRSVRDAVGPDNDHHIEQILRDADAHVVAWGRLSKLPIPLRSRWRDVVAIADRVGCDLLCLNTTLDGQPSHPVRLSYTRTLARWNPPR